MITNENKDVKEIVIDWLKINGYDGLYSDDCGCLVSDLMPCSGNEGISSCQAGYRHEAMKDCGFDYYIKPYKNKDITND